MTIRITPDFTLRRVAGQLAVTIEPMQIMLSAAQARDAAEAFTIMAVMLDGSAVEGVDLEIADPEFEGVPA